MTDDTFNISLNVATLPKKTNKSKSENAIPQALKAPKANFKLNNITKRQDVPEKTVLKGKSPGSCASSWKTFKQSNKTNLKPVAHVFTKEKSNETSLRFATQNLGYLETKSDNNDGVFINENHVKKKKKKGAAILRNDDKVMFPCKGNYLTRMSTSLFKNNPEIPDIPHKALKPLEEPVFSDMCFSDMALHPYMVKYLKESMGLTKMTTVQKISIPVLLEKKDALIRSQTGSGKTLAFALPILHHLQAVRPKISRSDGVLALIVVPTRELALQTYEVFHKLVKSYTWIVPGYLIGGEKRKSEKARLRKGFTILIGTPGRLVDHLQNTKCLNLEKVTWLILDEADRLFDLGYEKDVSIIISTLDKGRTSLLKPDYINVDMERKPVQPARHTVLLSATLTTKVMKLAGLSLTDPVFIDACNESRTGMNKVPIFSADENNTMETVALPASLVQQYIVVPAKLRLVILSAFILWKCKLTNEKKMLVFTATQDMVDYYAELLSTALTTPELEDSGTSVEFFKLHGSMNQKERTDVFNTFRKAESGVLFCTDVAARGLDLPEVDWVIQYTGPTSIADYVHRVGRTARGGQSGSSIIFLLPSEVRFIAELEDHRIRLKELAMQHCLKYLWRFYPSCPNSEEAASFLQSNFETIVAEQQKMHAVACKAYSSWSRFYASYPRNMKASFNIKSVHRGHYAKSFALRDPPSAIISYAKRKRLNEKRFEKDRPQERIHGQRADFSVKKKRSAEVSEFDSGLEPIKKKSK